MTPSISIITVSFNSESTITDTLRSVSEQTYPSIEHIVVDGGSRDETVALINQHGSRVAALVSEPDQGIYDAMNKGLRLASGDFVGFLNADDIFANSEVVADIAAVASADQVAAVYGDLVYVARGLPKRMVRHWHSGHFHRSRLRFGWMPPHPTLYMRLDVQREVGEFDLGFRISADYDFMLRFLARPSIRVEYLPKVLVRMKTGGNSNRSLAALLLKSTEDLRALRKNRVGGAATLLCKNLRKLPQFLASSRQSA